MRDLYVRRPMARYRRGRALDVRFWRGALRAGALILATVTLGLALRTAIVFADRCDGGEPVYARTR